MCTAQAAATITRTATHAVTTMAIHMITTMIITVMIITSVTRTSPDHGRLDGPNSNPA